MTTMIDQKHKTIWLQPWCDGCETHAWGVSDGRQWCQDDVWEDCSECGAKPVKYTLAAVTLHEGGKP